MAKRIYVGNLPWSYGSAELEQLFKQYGDVAAAEVIMDRETGRSRGFGFVQMANDGDMGAAIDGLNGQDCGGRPRGGIEAASAIRAKGAAVGAMRADAAAADMVEAAADMVEVAAATAAVAAGMATAIVDRAATKPHRRYFQDSEPGAICAPGGGRQRRLALLVALRDQVWSRLRGNR